MATQEQAQKIVLSTRTSEVQKEKFEENFEIIMKVPRGRVLKSALFHLRGYFTPTFTGTPVLNKTGIMDALISAIQFTDGYGNTIKNISPAWLRDMARFRLGAPGPELYQLNSQVMNDESAKQSNYFKPFELAATGQPVAFSCTVEIPFENVLSTSLFKTCQKTDGNSDCFFTVKTKSFKNIEKPCASPLVTACTGSAEIEMTLVEAPPEMRGMEFESFRQIASNYTIGGKLTNYRIDISRNGRLQGIRLVLRHGVGKDFCQPEYAKDVKIRLMRDGMTSIQTWSLQKLIESGSAKRFQDALTIGCGYMVLLSNSDFDTALDARNFNELYLDISTPEGLTYSPNATLEVGLDEIISFVELKKS